MNMKKFLLVSIVLVVIVLNSCTNTGNPQTNSVSNQSNKYGGSKMAYVIDTSKFNTPEIAAVTALQGIANRLGPKIILKAGATSSAASKFKSGAKALGAYPDEVYDKYDSPEDVWIDYYTKEYAMTFKEVTMNEAFEIFSDLIKFTIDYDLAIQDENGNISAVSPTTPGTALTMAGVYDAIPYAGTLKTKYPALKDKKVIDLKGKFKDSYEAQGWAVDNLLDKCSKEMASSCFTDAEAGIYLADLAVMKKGFVFKLNFVNQENMSHAGDFASTYNIKDDQLLSKILAHINDFGYIWGWGLGGENALASRVAMDSLTMINGCLPNGSFHAAVKPKEKVDWKQKHVNQNDVKVENKIYIAAMMGAGDTYQAVGSLGNSGYWMMKDRGKVPFNWVFDPMLYEIMPAMVQYFYKTKTDMDYFSSATAGYGYFHPAFFEQKNQMTLADKMNKLRQECDLKYIEIWWFSLLNASGKEIRWDWLKKTGYEGIILWNSINNATYDGSVPAVNSQLYFPYAVKYNSNEVSSDQKLRAKDTADCILTATKNLPKDSPFCTAIIDCSPWYVAEMQKLLPADRYEFVTMDKLFAIANKAKAQLQDISAPVFKFEP